MGKVWIQLFSHQLWVNSRIDCILWLCPGNRSRKRKTQFKPVKLCLRTDLVLHPVYPEGLVNAPIDDRQQHIYIYHQILLTVWSSLILSQQLFLSSIAPGRSSRLHPVSTQSWCTYVFDPIYQPLRLGRIWHKVKFLSKV